jgi:hypothetical protein
VVDAVVVIVDVDVDIVIVVVVIDVAAPRARDVHWATGNLTVAFSRCSSETLLSFLILSLSNILKRRCTKTPTMSGRLINAQPFTLDELPYELDKLDVFYRRNYETKRASDVQVEFHPTTKLPISVTTIRANVQPTDVLYSLEMFCGGEDKRGRYRCTPYTLVGANSKLRHCRARLRIDFSYDTDAKASAARLFEVREHGNSHRPITTPARTHYADKLKVHAAKESGVSSTAELKLNDTIWSSPPQLTSAREQRNWKRRFENRIGHHFGRDNDAYKIASPGVRLDTEALMQALEEEYQNQYTVEDVKQPASAEPVIGNDDTNKKSITTTAMTATPSTEVSVHAITAAVTDEISLPTALPLRPYTGV